MSCRRLGRYAAAFLFAAALAFAGFSLATPGHAASSAGLGVYRGAANPSQVGAFGTWLGRAPSYALDFFAGDTWTQIESPDWWLNSWQGSPYTVEYSVPIIPSSGGSLQEGATGAYNAHFQKLAQTLVAHGQGNAILRLGWEFNGSWYHWYAGDDPASFAAYWRQIVSTMRSVSPGLRFDWCPTLGANGMWKTGVDAAYPGDSYVDYIGTDVYDQSWGSNYTDPAFRWNEFTTEQNGLNWVSSFASQHGKPITIPEWGLSLRTDGHGGGDNSYFIQHMYDWITSHNVAFHMYFEYDASDGAHRLMTTQFPIGSAAYRQLFAGAAPLTSSSSSSSTATSTTTPTTSTTTPTTSTTAPTTSTTTPTTSTTAPTTSTTTPTTTTTSSTTTTTPAPTTTTSSTTTSTTTTPSTTTTTSPPPPPPTTTTTPPPTTTSTTPTTTSTTTTTTTTPTPTPSPKPGKCQSKRCKGSTTVSHKDLAAGASAVGAAARPKSCAKWRLVSKPPSWFWVWVRWKLGRAEFKGHGSASHYRPAAVPAKIPVGVWRQYSRFVRGQDVAVRACIR